MMVNGLISMFFMPHTYYSAIQYFLAIDPGELDGGDFSNFFIRKL